MIHWTNDGLMLGHCLRRWPNISLSLVHYVSCLLACRCTVNWTKDGGPGAVVKAAAWKIGDCRFEPHPGIQVSKNEMFLSHSLVKIQYCGEPPWPRGSVLSLRPPGLRVRIPCLEDSVITFISPSNPPEVLLAQFRLYVHKASLKPHSFISFHFSYI